jgi:alpha-tubulin suppressor-like RCC1 family protein
MALELRNIALEGPTLSSAYRRAGQRSCEATVPSRRVTGSWNGRINRGLGASWIVVWALTAGCGRTDLLSSNAERVCDEEQTSCGGVCTSPQTDVANCGACGNACRTDHGSAACVAGTCAVGPCSAGYADCDGNPDNGCEVQLNSDASHCGSCSRSCGGATPVCVLGMCSAVRSLAACQARTCAVLADGIARCWGVNGYGELGNGSTTSSSTPVEVSGLSGVVSIGAGAAHTCAVLLDGSAQCWGSNTTDQLGNDTTTDSLTPMPVSGVAGAVSITGGDNHTCAALADGTVRCWGEALFGQLGNDAALNSPIPFKVPNVTGVVSISAGGASTCASRTDGTAQCWGYNNAGQLGNNATDYFSPRFLLSGLVTVWGLTSVVSVSSGSQHTCAVLADGTVSCWGADSHGELGRVTAPGTDASSTPETVPNLGGAVSLGLGGNHSCAALTDGTARCWGENGRGQLGDGTTTDSLSPVVVSGLTGVILLAGGSAHTCAALSDGTVRCWGSNSYGQLGNGTTTDSSVPVTVVGLSP